MLDQLRKKFIRTAMISVLIVLGLILIAINFLNYRSFLNSCSRRITMIESAGGSLDDIRSGSKGAPEKPPEKPAISSQMAEAPYDTRYFSADLDQNKDIISVNMTDIASVTETTAEKMIRSAVRSGRTSGTAGAFRYHLSRTDANHYLIVFLNVGRDFSSVRNFFEASVLVGIIGIAAIFVLMRFLTKLAMAPANEAFEKQKQFITDASHEIKTPLAIISSNTEVIELENGESKWLKNITNQVGRLSALTEKLVLLSRMDEAGYKTPLSSFDLSELVRQTTSEYTERPVIIDAPAFLPYFGSRENIGRALSMLFDNAMKYSTGEVEVQLSGTPRTFSRIKKHGYIFQMKNPCGELPKGDLDMLFERFSRADSSRNSKTGGSGIGLAVVKEIVGFHKGSIHAFSEDGQSFEVRITL